MALSYQAAALLKIRRTWVLDDKGNQYYQLNYSTLIMLRTHGYMVASRARMNTHTHTRTRTHTHTHTHARSARRLTKSLRSLAHTTRPFTDDSWNSHEARIERHEQALVPRHSCGVRPFVVCCQGLDEAESTTDFASIADELRCTWRGHWHQIQRHQQT